MLHFKLVVIIPFIILGIIPAIVSFIYDCKMVFAPSIIISLVTIGDLILFCRLCREKNNYLLKETGGKEKLEIVVFEE